MLPCPSDLDWSRWYARELAEDGRARLLVHLDDCADCRAVCAALAPTDMATPLRASGDRYVLEEQIARGGMGRILRARDRVLDRTVALKVPHDAAGAQQRFAHEIAILARLSHPSIVTVLDAGQLDKDTPFLAMPFLAGRTLAADVAAGSRGPRTVLAIMPALSAVAYAHSIGIVHRDLKPENLFVGPYGECTVLDWGLAVDAGESSGSRGGSEGYASPEQRAGAQPTPDHDVYALGALLRFVMTGTHRAAADDTIPRELRSIIARAVAASGTRYATAAELMADVQRYLAGGRVLAHAYSVPERVRGWIRQHRTATAALVTALVVAGGIGAWSVWRIVGERDRALAAEHTSSAARERSRQLTEFLLDEVHRSVAELGRLDLAANLLSGLERHVRSTPSDAPPDIVQKLRLRQLMADIALAKGDHDQALTYLMPVEASLARLPRGDALTAELRCEALLRTAEAWLGKSDDAAAREALTACIAQITRVPSTVGTSFPRFDTAHTAAYAHVMLGDLERDRGDMDGALTAYRAGAGVLSGVRADGDARIAVQRLVLQAGLEHRIATIAQHRFQYADAEVHLRAALVHAEAAVARREHEASAQWLVAELQVALAVCVGDRGALDEKRALIEKAARIAEPLFAIDPTHEEHGRSMTIVWRVMAETGPPEDAPALFERILAVSRRRSQLAPRSPSAFRDLGVDLVATADWLIEHASTPDERLRAQRLCDEAVTVMQQRQRLLAPGAVDPDVAVTLVHCADVASRRGDRALAQRQRQTAIEHTRALASRAHPSMLTSYSAALAAYSTDATATDRRARQPELDRVWGELRAIGADDAIGTMRELAPWWRPPE